jgi:hypothetical protein
MLANNVVRGTDNLSGSGWAACSEEGFGGTG